MQIDALRVKVALPYTVAWQLKHPNISLSNFDLHECYMAFAPTCISGMPGQSVGRQRFYMVQIQPAQAMTQFASEMHTVNEDDTAMKKDFLTSLMSLPGMARCTLWTRTR